MARLHIAPAVCGAQNDRKRRLVAARDGAIAIGQDPKVVLLTRREPLR
jgi:hypothetical protein